MEGVAEALSAAVKYRMGPLTDGARRKKPFVLAGYTLATLARPLLSLAAAGWHVVFLRSLDRMGKGIRGVPRDALLAESVVAENYATAFSFHRAMDNAGSVLGPILAFALLQGLALPVRSVIALAIFPGLVSLAVLAFGVREEERPPRTRAAQRDGRLPSDVRRYLAVLTLFTLGASADSFLLLRAVDLGMPAAYTPLLWLALSASKALSNVPGGRIADAVGRRGTLVAGWILYAIAYGALAFVTNVWAFAGIVVAYGSYYGLAEGTERAILAERTPEEVRGRAFAAMHALTGLAVLPANLLFGVLYQVRASLAFGASAACAILAAVLLAVVLPGPRNSGTLEA
jgi:MFS family permease